MWKFIRYEWKHWITSPMLWIFLAVNTVFITLLVVFDEISLGGGVGSVYKNAPYSVQNYYGVMSLICLLMTTAFMNATANRDFQFDMYQLVFTTPIKKRDYFFGKFIGAATVSMIPLLGVSIGALIGPYMPNVDSSRYGDIVWSGHMLGLLSFGIPNTIITGVLLYGLAVIFRSNIVSFVGAMLIIVLYAVSSGLIRDIEKEWLANILDPFGLRPEGLIAKYMTVDEKNAGGVPLAGGFLYNRIAWTAMSIVILIGFYFKFSFNKGKEKVSKIVELHKIENKYIPTDKEFAPTGAGKFSWTVLFNLIKFETKAIVKNPTFITIVLLGAINLIASLQSFSGGYGTDQYPVTYDIIDTIRGSFYIFVIAIIIFYTGVLVWKERDAKISEIQDATPVKTGMLFTSKLVGVLLALVAIMSVNILLGILTQAINGYTRFQIDVYIKSLLVMDMFGFAALIVIALLMHYTINNRYIAYFAFVTFLIANQFLWGVIEVNSNMIKYSGTPSVTYSDMNGFGPYVPSLVWFNAYWFIFCTIIGIITFAFYVRGKELQLSQRLTTAKQIIGKNIVLLSVLGILLIGTGSFVYYNTQVLNSYDSSDERERKQIAYEKTYKKYENKIQPRFYKFDYNIDIQPDQRNMIANVTAWARNISTEPITEIHFTLPRLSDSLFITIPGAKLKLNDKKLSYRIYTLTTPLLPQDSIELKIDSYNITKGFENEVSFTQLTQNGTFFNNADFMPSFGYNSGYEIADKNKRKKLGLPKKIRMPKLNENDMVNRANTYIGSDADWVDVSTTISTTPDQIAIAPGSLIKSWEANGKKYFSYKLDQKSLNFYSFISARYEVARKKWKEIDLEVYYTKEHAYNVPNMLKSLEKSLQYYTANFGPYYHKQCRIIEFPRYASFAQAFPGTMPYSEGIGFIIDLREVTEDDIDQVYYVVAHEMGHQYWAHQLCGANMQGSEMMSEGFAQYSALMVMEKEYGKDKMKKFLKYEMDGYLRGRSSEFEAERPLMRTEGQQYIHYQKASVIMYYLKEMIGEEKVNLALKSLIDTFAYKQPPYATSLSAVRAFRQQTPDSLQYLIDDMFENITLFSNRVVEVNSKKVGEEYEVTLVTTSEKFRADSLGKEKSIPIADYIDVGIFGKQSDKNMGKPIEIRRLRVNKKDNTYVFRTKEKPYQAGIDPYNYLIDRIPDDNVKKVSDI